MKINIDKTKNIAKKSKKRNFIFPKWKLPSLILSKKVIGFLFIYTGVTIFFSLIGWAVSYPPIVFLTAIYNTGVIIAIIFITIMFIICGIVFMTDEVEKCKEFWKD